jgi:hypothetical protein
MAQGQNRAMTVSSPPDPLQIGFDDRDHVNEDQKASFPPDDAPRWRVAGAPGGAAVYSIRDVYRTRTFSADT